MDFEQYWQLIGGSVNFSDRKTAAEKVWSLCPPEKQRAIIAWLQTHGRYTGRNPYFFILDFQIKRSQVLTMNEYYTRFGTTEEQDGWRREFRPDEQRTIYKRTWCPPRTKKDFPQSSSGVSRE